MSNFDGHSNAAAFVSSAKVQICRCDRRNSDLHGGIVLGFNAHLESSACERSKAMSRPIQMNGKYTIELCRPGGEDTGIERVFERQDDLAIARKLYRRIATEYPGRVVMLCDRAHVLARSDRLDTMPD